MSWYRSLKGEHTLLLGSVGVLPLAMICMQAGASIAKTLFPAIGPVGVTFWRLLLAAIIMFVFSKAWQFPPSRKSIPAVTLYGISLAGMNFTFYCALDRLPLGIVVAIEFMGPLGLALLGSRRLIDGVWSICAIGGLSLLLPVGNMFTSSHDGIGVLYGIAAAFFWAMYIIIGRKAGHSHGPTTPAWGVLMGTVLSMPWAVWYGGTGLWSIHILPTATVVALISTAIPYNLEMYGLRRLPLKVFGTLMSLDPAIAAILGWLILGERLSFYHVLGILLVVVASIGVVNVNKKAVSTLEASS